MPIFDAHCHLQDDRLNGIVDDVLKEYDASGATKAVVNGTHEGDWDRVQELAEKYESVMPSHGLHPWFVSARGKGWKEKLLGFWESSGSHVGEIGLDRWIENYDMADQVEVFTWQLRQAVRMDKACSIHCLKAFAQLLSALESEPRLPPRGFLLHSYGGSLEMMRQFARMGAYFSFSAYFALDRKSSQRAVFQEVPIDRLLIETDAPDMLGPEALDAFTLEDNSGKPVNDPRNIELVYDFVAKSRGMSRADFDGQIANNFSRLFGT